MCIAGVDFGNVLRRSSGSGAAAVNLSAVLMWMER